MVGDGRKKMNAATGGEEDVDPEKYHFVYLVSGSRDCRFVYRFPVSRSNPEFYRFVASCDWDGWANKETWEDDTVVPKADWLALSIGRHSRRGFFDKFGDGLGSEDYKNIAPVGWEDASRYWEPVHLEDYTMKDLERVLVSISRIWVKEEL